jgi:hypothetical protein
MTLARLRHAEAKVRDVAKPTDRLKLTRRALGPETAEWIAAQRVA